MSFDFLTPLTNEFVAQLQNLPQGTIQELASFLQGDEIQSVQLSGYTIAIVGIKEYRNSLNAHFTSDNIAAVREQFYSLYTGDWNTSIIDLGDIDPGDQIADTYYAVKSLSAACLKSDTLLITIGGSQDLMYPLYRSFDNLHSMVNVVNVDCRFDLGDIDAPITSRSYVGKMVSEMPYNLFNYANLGFQTYYNSQDEIDLLDKMYFDAVRLGELDQNLKISEPYMRDADLVGIDMQSIASSSIAFAEANPNGIDGKQICTLSRYAGISDRSKIFSIFELPQTFQTTSVKLISEMIWYFIEGVNYRCGEYPLKIDDSYIKYQVPIDDQVIVFFKSIISGRWWVELPFFTGHNNKLKQRTLLPCDENDYNEAINGNLPQRWLRARMKNEI